MAPNPGDASDERGGTTFFTAFPESNKQHSGRTDHTAPENKQWFTYLPNFPITPAIFVTAVLGLDTTFDAPHALSPPFLLFLQP